MSRTLQINTIAVRTGDRERDIPNSSATDDQTWLLLGDGTQWSGFVDQLAVDGSIIVSAQLDSDISSVRSTLALRLPTLVVVDWCTKIPEAALKLFELMRLEFPTTAIVAAVRDPTTESRVKALNAGADDCVGYEVDGRELAARAAAISRRRNPPSPFGDRSVPERVATLARQHRLSNREQEVLALLVRGIHLKSMGTYLGCSYPTIRTHVRRICSKLDCSCQREVLARFIAEASD